MRGFIFKLIYLFSFFYAIIVSGQNVIKINGQSVINFVDTLSSSDGIKYINYHGAIPLDTFDFGNLNDFITNDSQVKSLSIQNFIHGRWIDPDNYNNIYFTTSNDIILFDMDGNMSFDSSHIYEIEYDTILLSFSPKNHVIEPLTIKVLTKREGKNVSFQTFTILTGQYRNYNVAVWPYQFGPKIKVGQDFEFKLGKVVKYFDLNEHFLLDNVKYKFSNFDYVNKKITIQEVSGTEKLLGYKVGYFFNEWIASSEINWDSLGINRDKSHLIYFGATWCGACIPAIKSLKNLYSKILLFHNIGLISVNTGNRNEDHFTIADYVENNAIPGISVVEKWNSHKPFVDNFKVISYPTFIFLSSNGKILFRSDYNDSKLNEFILDYIKEQ